MKKTVTGIAARNSLAYIKAVFDSYAVESPVVLLRSVNDETRKKLTNVTQTIEPKSEFGWFTDSYQFSHADSLAQVSFTSGTEGEPKGVFLTHCALSDVTQRLNAVMEVDSSISEYVGVPAHFSFGLGRFRAISAVGGRAFLPEFGFNPLEIRDMLKAGEINAISAVPTLWRILLKNKSIFGSEVRNVKWIEIGSQYMSRAEKEALKSLFSKAIIVQHYGLTEASRSTFLRVDEVNGGKLESVGTVVGETEIKISAAGHICVRGKHVAKTLLVQGKHAANVDDTGWLHTNDLGRIEEGYLYYEGRADDLINCGGIKLSPDALERDICDELMIKSGLAIAGFENEMTGQGVLVVCEAHCDFDKQEVINIATSVLVNYGINNKHILKLFTLDKFPITATGKVQRKEIAKLYEQHALGEDESILTVGCELDDIDESNPSNVKPTENEVLVRSIWQQVLSVKHLDLDANFYQLGGDSLTAISAVVEIEKMDNVPAQVSKGLLQGLTVREVAKQLANTDSNIRHQHKITTPEIKAGMTINIVRGFLVLFVILAHWSGGILERLPSSLDFLAIIFAPAFSMGTPGFSIIYGVGAGFSMYSIYQSDPIRLKGILHKTVLLLVGGIVTLAVVNFGKAVTVVAEVTFTHFTNSFYSVLTYYLLISLTLYFWFGIISRFKSPAVFSLFLAIVFYTLHTFLIRDIGMNTAEGIVELIKLLFTAKYSYFLMLTGTMIGISIGIFTRRLIDNREPLSIYFVIGSAVMIFGVVLSVHAGDAGNWFSWPIRYNYIWRWMFYVGVILLMMATVDKLLHRYSEFKVSIKFIFQFFSVVGLLAFPLFITHEMVLPIKIILNSYGVPAGLSLMIPMCLFLVSTFFMFRKVYRVSFL